MTTLQNRLRTLMPQQVNSVDLDDAADRIDALASEVQKLKGQQSALIGLLRESLEIVNIADGDDSTECEALIDLSNRMKYAINGAMQEILT